MYGHTPTPTPRPHGLGESTAHTAARVNMTVRLSYDECQSWPVARRLHDGPAAYSDLAVTPDGMIHCLYERGDEHPYEALCLARFDLAWLTEGQS